MKCETATCCKLEQKTELPSGCFLKRQRSWPNIEKEERELLNNFEPFLLHYPGAEIVRFLRRMVLQNCNLLLTTASYPLNNIFASEQKFYKGE